MPYSKKQLIAARIALAAKRNPRRRSKLTGASLKMYRSMSTAELEDFARGPVKKQQAR